MDFILEALQLAFIGMTVVLIFLTLLMYVVVAVGKLLPPDAQPATTPRAVAADTPSTADSGAVTAAIAIAVALYRRRRR